MSNIWDTLIDVCLSWRDVFKKYIYLIITITWTLFSDGVRRHHLATLFVVHVCQEMNGSHGFSRRWRLGGWQRKCLLIGYVRNFWKKKNINLFYFTLFRNHKHLSSRYFFGGDNYIYRQCNTSINKQFA